MLFVRTQSYLHFIPISGITTPANNLLHPQIETKYITFDSVGIVYEDSVHKVSIRIPPGAVPHNSQIILEISVMMFGPFIFPDNLKPISPILRVCGGPVDMDLMKPVEIALPHCLDIKGVTAKELRVVFGKVRHTDIKKNRYEFECLENEVTLNDEQAILFTRHFCDICLLAPKTRDVTKRTKYYLYPFVATSNIIFAVGIVLPIFDEVCNKQFIIVFSNIPYNSS